jgi:hypothetical protein
MIKRSPMGQNIVCFDLEIKNIIDGKEITWNDHDKLGISVGVAFDYLTGEFKVFMDDNIEGLVSLLNRADIVTGFNITGFDIPCLNATCKAKFTNEKAVYDLLYFSRVASGWRPGDPYPRGMKLDDHLRQTFGEEFMKTSHGEEAPKMWQSGRLGELISYCIDDVKRECFLFEHVYANCAVKTEHGFRKLIHPDLIGVSL